MLRENLKSKCPIIYEYYMSIKTRKMIENRKKKEEQFYSMSDLELRNFVNNLYKDRIGHSLDWNNLQTYTEKMQWSKLYNNYPLKSLCSDKYAVRKWVADCIGEEYLIPLIGVWDSFSEIDFKKLPNQFVIKTNHGSGDVVIIKDKSEITKAKKMEINRKITQALKTDYSALFGELHYKEIVPKIVAEEFIDPGDGGDLQDYKFMCFDGVVYYCWVDTGRTVDHRRNVYDLDWNLQNWTQYYPNTEEPLEKPDNFDEMVELAKKLCKGFDHVRVDLYNVNGKIYFGEMTFTNGGGFKKITPEENDLMLGTLWNLKTK